MKPEFPEIEPTELAPSETETGSIYAWALDPDDPDGLQTHRLTSRRITVLSVATSLILVAVAACLALGIGQQPRPVEETQRTMSAPSAVVPPVPAPAPTPAPSPEPSAYDQNFLSLMTQEGWGCTDNATTAQCGKEMISFAHEACSYSGLDISTVYQNLGGDRFLAREERRLLANAEQAYPNCTFIDPQATPAAPVAAACADGATRVVPRSVGSEEGDPETCEDGQWHEGPLGYGGG